MLHCSHGIELMNELSGSSNTEGEQVKTSRILAVKKANIEYKMNNPASKQLAANGNRRSHVVWCGCCSSSAASTNRSVSSLLLMDRSPPKILIDLVWSPSSSLINDEDDFLLLTLAEISGSVKASRNEMLRRRASRQIDTASRAAVTKITNGSNNITGYNIDSKKSATGDWRNGIKHSADRMPNNFGFEW